MKIDQSKIINDLFMVPYKVGGRDRTGFDCWGLVVILYNDLLGIEIPEYHNIILPSMSKCEYTSCEIQEQINNSFPFKEVSNPLFGDVVMFNIQGNPLHIGFVLDASTMIHTSSSTGVAVENFRGIKWNKRIAGFWRHISSQLL